MKKSILALCALTLAAGLVACGGGTSTYTIGGTVAGLQHPGLILTNNLTDDVSVSPLGLETNGSVKNVTYRFSKELDYGDTYSVTIKKQPDHQICQASSGTVETAGRLSVIDAVFVCNLVSNTIGGKITGLAADNLVLTNGSNSTLAITKDPATGAYPTSFTFGTPVTFGQTFGVTVLTQPTNQTCTVTGGTGEMGDNPIDTISVSCVTNAT